MPAVSASAVLRTAHRYAKVVLYSLWGYAVQYQGGKFRIATKLASVIRSVVPIEHQIHDVCCGGGAMSLALAKAGFIVQASDIHPDLILMWQAVQAGDSSVFASLCADVTAAEYEELRNAAPSARRGFVGFGASFGGSWFAGMGAVRKQSVKRPDLLKAQPWHESRRSVARMVGQPVTFALADYTATPDAAVAYCDKPYQGTKPYKSQPAFDHAAFWNWVRQRSGATFISELTGPDDIEIIWRQQHKSQNASNSPVAAPLIQREERLYYKAARHA